MIGCLITTWICPTVLRLSASAEDSESSFDGLETMESRMEAHLLTISTLISERESAWEEFESLDVR